MHLDGTLRIRIVGGSLGGLFAAALLRMDGHQVRVYERSASGLAGRGAGLVGQRDIFAILRVVGCEHVANVGVVAVERITFDRDGRVVHRQATPQMQISWDHLYRSFRALVPGDDYVLGRAVRSVRETDEVVRLDFEDGSDEVADLVIGADGVGSVVRHAVTGEASPSIYAGYVAWRGLFPESALPAESAALLLDRFAFYMMPSSHILGYTVTGPNGEAEKGARRYNWVWYRPISEGELGNALTDVQGRVHLYSLGPSQLPDSRRQALVEDAGRLLPPPFAAAVAAERQPFIQAIFDYETPRMTHGRLALLGDAAFVVRPHTAMGVAKAAGDAMALRSCLARLPYAEALQAYQRERLPIGVEIAAYGRQLGARLG
jgi:2-polyprenyl-6-methoxyphenol hydroxylase-like FAD-dependent oxidoreductase